MSNLPPTSNRQKAAPLRRESAWVCIGKGFDHKGFSLAEVVAALGIATFALVVIVGLLPTSMGATRDAVQSTEAAQIASAIACDLRSSAQHSSAAVTGTSAIYNIPLQSGTYPLNTASFATRFRTQVVITPESSATFTANNLIAPVMHAAILLVWPPTAPASKASSHLEIASSFTPSRL